LVFTFQTPITGCGVANTGTVVSGPLSNQCTVNLTGLPNAQYTTVTLTGVTNAAGSGNASGTMGLLVGDTTADGSVNSADIGQTKSQSGHTVTGSNFREDVTVDGSINSADIGLVKSKSGTALPTLP
jgi:translation elongation factor EF-Tu-like GTPase